jgi:hypothetical protein
MNACVTSSRPAAAAVAGMAWRRLTACAAGGDRGVRSTGHAMRALMPTADHTKRVRNA